MNKNDEQLLEACSTGNSEMVRSLLEMGADVTSTDIKGNTAFYNIVIKRVSDTTVDIADMLLSHGAAINNSMQWDGDTVLNTLLIENIHAGNSGKVEMMLKQGMNPDFSCKIHMGREYFQNMTPINEAIITAIRYRDGNSVNEEKRSVGIRKSDVRYSTARDSDFAFRESKIPDIVSFNAMKEIIMLLFNFGANPENINTYNLVYYGNDDNNIKETIRLLVENGLKKWDGFSLIGICKKFDMSEIFDFMSSNGVDLNTPGADTGIRLIHHLCRTGTTPEKLQSLINKGIDVNAMVSKHHGSGFEAGDTPLLLTLICEHPELAIVLIDNGADTSVKTPGGKTALSIAKENKLKKVIERLQ